MSSARWARTKFEECRQNHEACRPSDVTQQRPMPTRILYVGTQQQPHIRLIDSSQLFQPYACLSYHCGEVFFLDTNSSNLAEHRIQIPFSSLPFVFIRAITVVRNLGIRFLWIDCLCIIQDDPQDWTTEVANMANIYQNADLVISATKSGDVHVDLFSTNDPDAEEQWIAKVEPDGRVVQIGFRRSLAHLPGPFDEIPPEINGLPLLSRGWAFQERLLARRVLHFGPQELFWECLSETHCQCVENHGLVAEADPSTDDIWGSRALLSKDTLQVQRLRSLGAGPRTVYWHGLVAEYSKRHLAYERDIFPAFAGVTGRFQTATGLTEVAGLWEETLECDLLWHVAPHNWAVDAKFIDSRRRARVPTWSWASVQLPVRFIDTSDGLRESYITIRIGRVNYGALTRVRAAYIELDAFFIPATLSYSIDLQPDSSLPQEMYRLCSIDSPEDNIWAVDGFEYNVWADYNTSNPGDGYVAEGAELFCLIVGRMDTEFSEIKALILKGACYMPGSIYPSYERIGLLEVYGDPFRLDEWIKRNATRKYVTLV